MKGGEIMSDLSNQIEKLESENQELKDRVEELEDELSVTETGESLTSKVPFKVGKKYFIRTVTYFVTGKVKKISGGFLVLENAAWIADTGRFSDALKSGNFSEVEPVDVQVYLNLNSITDGFEWLHKLPRDQK